MVAHELQAADVFEFGSIEDDAGETLAFYTEGYYGEGLAMVGLQYVPGPSIGAKETTGGQYRAVGWPDAEGKAAEVVAPSLRAGLDWAVHTTPKAQAMVAALQDRSRFRPILRSTRAGDHLVRWSTDGTFCMVRAGGRSVSYLVKEGSLELTMAGDSAEKRMRMMAVKDLKAGIEEGQRLLSESFRLSLAELMAAPFQSVLF
ncbi:MAG: hypothetical protein ACYCRD_04775 [Leptospirillum sp.]